MTFGPNRPNWRNLDSQETDNREHDFDLGVKKVMQYGQDGVSAAGARSDFMSIKMTVDGDITYIGYAAPGTATTAAQWQAIKIDETGGNMRMTWADGNAAFDNVVTDLTALTYS